MIKSICVFSFLLVSVLQVHAADKVFGKVSKQNGEALAGYKITIQDEDSMGNEYMGQGYSDENGNYSISYIHKHWDWCCGQARRPDIILKLYINNSLKQTSSVYNNWVMKIELQKDWVLP